MKLIHKGYDEYIYVLSHDKLRVLEILAGVGFENKKFDEKLFEQIKGIMLIRNSTSQITNALSTTIQNLKLLERQNG